MTGCPAPPLGPPFLLMQPLGKGQLQRLFHNLCANSQTREVRAALCLLWPGSSSRRRIWGLQSPWLGPVRAPTCLLADRPLPPANALHWLLQTLLRLLLSILRGPLSADEAAAAAAAGGEDGGAGADAGSSMEGVQQQLPGGLRLLAEGPVIDLGK